ncbi:restriction endonuclease [Bacillus bingmayongensis]|uniref:restriction endonuclease n=1 Tax=Bacillus bingmayongensis TaxID=1150157 RepID=UPI0003105BC5|nr:restriction endonuclease [Bacillus bingmayongensis]
MDWNSINPRHFEKFIFHVLGKKGFKNREWFGRGGGDKGRDVVAKYYVELPFNLGYEQKWIFQCKRVKKMPQQSQVYNEIATAKQHHPDAWVLVTPHNPTANFYDYLHSLEQSMGFKLIVFSLAELEEIVHENKELKHVLIYGHLPEDEGEEENV